MKKVVLFGAGAESGFGLSNGVNFAYSVIGHDVLNMNRAVKLFYKQYPENNWRGNYITDRVEIDKLVGASILRKYMAGEYTSYSYDEYIIL